MSSGHGPRQALETVPPGDHHAPMTRFVPELLVACALLASCDGEPEAPMQAQRISFEEVRGRAPEPTLSPDTGSASWKVSADGRAIDFGPSGGAPLLTLACNLRETPATLILVRHTSSRPGQKALLPVIGNGTISRFKVDAALADGEWRWEGRFPATDPQLDVFTGPRELEATLPGGGTLQIAGSRIPGEFVNWCRAGGRVQRAEAAENEPPTAPPTSAGPEPVEGR
jgi:hypothetical protein